MVPQSRLAPADPTLTSFAIAFMQSEDVYIADKVFPWMPTRNLTGNYAYYTIDDGLRDDFGDLVDDGESPILGFTKTKKAFSCARRGGKMLDNDDLIAEWSGPGTVDEIMTRFLMMKAMINVERNWHNAFFKTGIWGTDYDGEDADNTTTGRWDRENVDFIRNIQIAMDTVQSKTAQRPNVLVLSGPVFTSITNLKFYRDLRAENEQWKVEHSKLERTLGLRVLVSRAAYAKNRLGANADVGFITSKNALLVYVDPTPSPLTPTAGRIFSCSNRMGKALGSGMGFAVYRYAEQAKFANAVDMRANWDMRVTAKDLGVFWENIIS